MSMLALTVRQPWASEIVMHRKNVENRDWRPRRDPGFQLYIHADKQHDDTAYYRDMLTLDQITPARYGAVIGVCTVESWHEYESCKGRCSPWPMPFRWHWQLRRPHALTPVPCKGRLGLWTLPDDFDAPWLA